MSHDIYFDKTKMGYPVEFFSVRCECIKGMPETNGEVNERKSLIRLVSCKTESSSSEHSQDSAI